MAWTTDLLFIICFTTLTGGILTAVWRFLGSLLERIGFLNISYRLMQVIMIFWLVPLIYMTLWDLDNRLSRWGGDLLLGTPVIYYTGKVFAVIWLIGFAANMIRYAIEIVRVYRIRKSTFQSELNVEEVFSDIRVGLGIHKNVLVRQSWIVSVPQVTGYFRPMVLLPVQSYPEEELRLIFSHELMHVKHQDILMKNLGMLIRAVHFMNPLAWWYCHLLDRWGEFACDYEVCRKSHNIKNYYTVLMDMAQECRKRDMIVSRIIEGKSELYERIRHVTMSYKKRPVPRMATAMILSVVVAISGSTVCFAAVESADALQYINQETAVDTEEVNEQLLLQEYVETETTVDAVEMEGETEFLSVGVKATGASFSWTISKNTLMKTSTFSASSGKTISIGVQNPSGASIRVGIILPNGKKRYVSSSNYNVSHDFSVSTTGSYRVYVQNMSNSKISVSGNYYVV